VQSYTLIGVPTETVLMESKSYAVYGELTRTFLQDRLELTAGFRHYHDDVSQLGQLVPGTPFTPASGTFEANTPRGVLTWHVNERLMTYASYSEGFRSGFPQDPAVPAGFPPVTPDRLKNYEIGSKGSLMQGLLGYDSAVYYMKWSGIQQQIYVPYGGLPDGAVAVLNGQSASGVGVDFALSAQPAKGLLLTLDASWNNLQMDSDVVSGGVVLFNKGDRPNYSPETTASASAQYEFALGSGGYRGSLAGSVTYTSPQSYRGLFVGLNGAASAIVQTGDPMTIGRVSFAVNSPANWSGMLYVNNVNNERGTPIEAFLQVPNWNARIRPRTAGVQFEYHFR
jgi:outer membrane receptor protein involved in Fe transport